MPRYDTEPIPPWGHVYNWLRRQWYYRRLGRLNSRGIHEASYVKGWDDADTTPRGGND